ncbi:MAG: 16S rRNA (cytidine(1402)-2'-O)-methyltransferase [Bacteroidales bacterium]|nr:16S rRNA (cytidine(1402)-2'-O)-methyltransferase [Bacteroidales bacterium]
MKLYIVPTPIGNLEDITLRALNVLKSVDFILAEDTRTTKHLLQHYQIDKRCLAYHIFNEHAQVDGYVRQIRDCESVALVSDAGTPGISDPGFLLIRECVRQEIPVECLPGATALIPALVQSGLPCSSFYFYGFLPHKKGKETLLKRFAEMEETVVCYESPHRLLKSLEKMQEILGPERSIAISKELTKIHEFTFRGTIREAVEHFSKQEVKGEFVIVLGRAELS